MKFTIENVDKAFEQARQNVLNDEQYKGKTAMELLSDEGLIHQLDELSSAKDLLKTLIDFDDMDWAKDKRELSAKEMVDFIAAVSCSEAVSFWGSTDDDWEAKAIDHLEFELNYLIDLGCAYDLLEALAEK